MSAFLVYIIKWTICLAVLYIPFTLLLRKETFASLNRLLAMDGKLTVWSGHGDADTMAAIARRWRR